MGSLNIICQEMPPASKHFDYKHYLTKKTMAQGLLDISLLMSNMSQLKSVLDSGQDSSYFILLVTLISVSLVLQVIVAHMLWILAVSRGSTQEQLNRQNILNNTIIILILIITVSNIFITAFAVQNKN
ncbi:ninjurin-2 isoform X5 [Octopus bimaculoides]|uniref:ninjurin-2 isoform X5 n=1 Tax=Octopus bimaculoides TaxID=37653 RepID=UPI0022E48BCC|nr:ninjurin-2 isoform X5 [Octopus bimaculoides]